MRARAALATTQETRADRSEHSRISTLRSQSPLDLRATLPTGPEPWIDEGSSVARVRLAASGAGPIGGDHFRLDIDVGTGSTLVLGDVSTTLLLPGPHDEESHLEVDVRVGTHATLVWLPEPVIAAHGCRHRNDIRIALEPGARLLLREELLLGRFGEEPGTVRQHLHVRLDGHPLLDQQLTLGPDAPAYDGPAVTGGHCAIGSLLIVDPAWTHAAPAAIPLEADAAVMPLNGPAVLVSALSPDALTLRRRLDTGLALLEHPPDAADNQTPEATTVPSAAEAAP